MNIQAGILLFCSSLHNAVTVKIAQFFTVFGTELPLIALMLFVYYAVDKKKGASSCLTFMLASNIMSIIKAIVRFPRPWKVIDGLDSQSMSGATGYSFPSGHTTCAASAFASIAVEFRKKWLSRLSAVLIALVGLSRIFLCVHWPLDVAGGLLVGCGCALLLARAFEKLLSDKAKTKKVMIPIGIVASAAALAMGILLNFNLIDETAFSDFSKSLAAFGGLAIGVIIEIQKFNFKVEKGNWGKKVLRYVLSMVGVLFILPLSKVILNKVGLYNPITAHLRYFATGFWVTVYPIVASKLFPEQEN